MAKLHQIGNIIIRVYANDHLPPHFHVIGPDDAALVEIASQTVIAGAMPRPHRAEVEEWIADSIDVIRAEWNRINPRFPV
jgi:hypothetical protein